MSTAPLTCFIGGIVGAVLMDFTEAMAARRGISSGVNIALVGRWVLSLTRGTLRHRDIRTTAPMTHEVAFGWLFHLLVAGGGVALVLPLGLEAMNIPAGKTAPLPYLLFGLATSLLPWFILLPSFGWGVGGRRAPAGSNALLASLLSHIPYGLGIWLTVVLADLLYSPVQG